MEEIEIEYHKNILQSANINFLIGSGLSRPFLSTLGDIEKYIESVEGMHYISDKMRKYLKVTLLNQYFQEVMYPNISILDEKKDADREKCVNNYSCFLRIINEVIRKRGSTIINKQANIFTTNIDLFFEKTIEDLGLDFNDGFSGRITPTFSLSNYNKIVSKCSHQFDNESKIPIINLLKLHGSLNWRYGANNEIVCSFEKEILEKIYIISKKHNFKSLNGRYPIIRLKNETAEGDIDEALLNEFQKEYDKLPLVNPTKKKFKETTLNLYYYEMLRFFSNELEKETTVLYIMGFSMADEHICEIIVRAAKNNPTLTIFIFAYDAAALKDIKSNMKNKEYINIKYICPESGSNYDFETINNVFFKNILDAII